MERIITINLKRAYDYTRTKRAKRAIKVLKKELKKHTKNIAEDVIISNALNNYVWKHGMCKPPRKVKVRVIVDGNIAKVYLFSERIEKKAEKERKEDGKVEKKDGKEMKESTKEVEKKAEVEKDTKKDKGKEDGKNEKSDGKQDIVDIKKGQDENKVKKEEKKDNANES